RDGGTARRRLRGTIVIFNELCAIVCFDHVVPHAIEVWSTANFRKICLGRWRNVRQAVQRWLEQYPNAWMRRDRRIHDNQVRHQFPQMRRDVARELTYTRIV